MITSKEEWTTSFKELQSLLKKPGEHIANIIELSLDLHAFTHETEPENLPAIASYEDQFWNLNVDYTKFSEKKLYSPAWHMWHSARIEDITCAHFILQTEEVMDAQGFHERLNIPFRHTGNSMNLEEMNVFNTGITLPELREYRREVCRQTRTALKNLTAEQLTSRVSAEAVKKIQKIGSVVQNDTWLLDYWGKKRITGILTMPLTRHLMVHINSAMRSL